MKILLLGLFFWAFAIVVVAKLLRLGTAGWPPSKARIALWSVCTAAAALLIFRPHQDFFGGQDQGAYANVAVSYARHGALSYTDPLLSQIPEETRSAFFYGDENFPDTKYMCFWVEDIAAARIDTWFQPAFPVLMSVAAALGPDTWVLYVTPVFTLFTAIALWALAGTIFNRRWAGAAAFVLYLANPVTVWHGRGVRAEAAAAFFIFAGAAFLARAWLDRKRPALNDILAGSLCLALAPFLHVSAWLVVVPAAAALSLVTLAGYTTFVFAPAATLAGLAAFIFQTGFVTDSYDLARYLGCIFRRPVAWSWAGVGLIVALGAGSLCIRKFGRKGVADNESCGSRATGTIAAVTAIVTATIMLLAYLNVFPGPDKTHAVWVLRLIGFTQLDAFAAAVTRPLALAGLAGWIGMIVLRDERRNLRLVLALILFPAIIMVGDMPILMYFLRRAFTVIVPAFALSLVALVCLIPERPRLVRLIAVPAAVAALLLPGLCRRTLLFKQVDYKGFPSFLERFANVVKKDQGILLCEYSRIAAPFEHLFGIPTLGLDNEHRFEYGPALEAWKKIIQEHPDKPAYFMTPFGPPLEPGFVFEPVISSTHRMSFLRSAPGRLPTTIREPLLKLSLYRMYPSENPDSPARAFDWPYVREFDETNVGLRGFDAGRRRGWEIGGYRLEAGKKYLLSHEDNTAGSNRAFPQEPLQLVLFCRCSEGNVPAPVVHIAGVAQVTDDWRNLADEWWVYCAPVAISALPPDSQVGPASPKPRPAAADKMEASDEDAQQRQAHNLRSGAIQLQPGANMMLAAAMLAGHTETKHLAVKDLESSPVKIEMFSRWARADARVAIPEPRQEDALLLMFVNPSHPEEHRNLSLRIAAGEGSETAQALPIECEGWQWLACSLPGVRSDAGAGVQWMKLTTTPPWNPGLYGYPRDLGVQLKYLAILPGMERKDER